MISGAAEPSRAARARWPPSRSISCGAARSWSSCSRRRSTGRRLDPGYIKGYPPGIRENGGQYTHAAIWSVMAFAALGDGDKANELFSILNPINRASTRAGVHRYKVEPYVAAADVYAESPHVGRGGWTWYTGSAGWMYRAGHRVAARVPSARRGPLTSIPASRARGAASRSRSATTRRATRSPSRIRAA